MHGSDPNRLTGRTWYRIRIRGRLSETDLVGIIEDQAHLFGVLDRIRDLGLDLVSVEPDGERDLAN